ncbi:MAG: type II toxin-antitoxin system PemK/MazF family toxin [Oscillospiraceae bacterium]|nr:type II toxin-antitoxin system PemK/MazF family toxin [Oscillospiraceae bacterium]
MKQFEKIILRGDIYYADLNPTVGSEQGGVRPLVILQNNVGNRYSPTVIAAAITARPKKPLPTHARIGHVCGRLKESFVLLEQIRTIDRSRLREYVGRLSTQEMKKIDEALAISVGLAPAPILSGRETP